ncbi:MAG: hypothetical protein NTU53_13060 [Planctomycetota bacterium]|nr:hypothetical protein [Planctomycetota bacterium]
MPIRQLLVQNHVNIAFQGHEHLYAKQDLDGIVYQEVPQPGDPRGNSPDTRLSWKLELPAGAWRAQIICSAAYAGTNFVVELAGEKASATAGKTPGWFDYQTIEVGP